MRGDAGKGLGAGGRDFWCSAARELVQEREDSPFGECRRAEQSKKQTRVGQRKVFRRAHVRRHALARTPGGATYLRAMLLSVSRFSCDDGFCALASLRSDLTLNPSPPPHPPRPPAPYSNTMARSVAASK